MIGIGRPLLPDDVSPDASAVVVGVGVVEEAGTVEESLTVLPAPPLWVAIVPLPICAGTDLPCDRAIAPCIAAWMSDARLE